jgi:ferredoxin
VETSQDHALYRRLQQHFDAMPIGFPKTRSGIEIKLLKSFFTPIQAQIALVLSFKYQNLHEIAAKLSPEFLSSINLQKELDTMASRAIFRVDQDGTQKFALIPFVTGMYEMQIKSLSPEFVDDVVQYYREGFGIEYITTPIPQMRIIPIEESITPENKIATYDELAVLIEKADHITIAECVCKKSRDIMHKSCQRTQRREVCLYLRHFGENFIREQWGRAISKEEALQIIRQNQQEGLIVHSSNEQEPQFICSCCACCCGVLANYLVLPKPGQVIAHNFIAYSNPEVCIGCGKCISRCQLNAISLKNGKARVDLDLCIGCGVCIPACVSKALCMKPNYRASIPPKTTEEMYTVLAENKKTQWQKLRTILGWNPLKVWRNMKKAS